ncbi:AraC family transcriptional regulator [Lederbergia ruris]|uniref:AraC family transcriptional regulator n=1 Tax=Lederbergia ruris TaxID=217495 RepID=A0ABQ4KF08_9BACI|nr:AraC family transcriptional regulator [Lederbergia ruris]GIN56066.1 AraC family transcriptional regulator [Lederbergia ruris]
MDKQILQYSSSNFFMSHMVSDPPYDVATHIHDCYELFYFISGDLTYYIEGQAYKLYPNDLIITNSKELHRIVFNSASRYERKYIHFHPEYISSYQTDEYNILSYIEKRKLGYFNRIPAEKVFESGINELWNKIDKASIESSPESPIMLKTFFVQMLIAINKNLSNYNPPLSEGHRYDQKINTILDFINKNLDEKITLDLLEHRFYVSKYYLCHIFKTNTGFTVMEYVTYKRIMRALELLMFGHAALDTAHRVGFRDYSTFYKAFKKITGTSPNQYFRK